MYIEELSEIYKEYPDKIKSCARRLDDNKTKQLKIMVRKMILISIMKSVSTWGILFCKDTQVFKRIQYHFVKKFCAKKRRKEKLKLFQ